MHPSSRPLAVVGLLLWISGCHAGKEAAFPGSVLPLRSLKLYETGVSYFERSGTLSKDNSVTLPVPTGHLDDALKTLVVSANGGNATLSGVEFSSSLSRGMARALAGLPADADEPITYLALLSSMKGADVEIRTHGKVNELISARLIDVLQREQPKTNPPANTVELTLLVVTSNGEFRRLESSEVSSIRPTDATFQARVSAALDALSVRSAQNLRALRLLAASEKPVTLGYLAEAPIWRSSYRLVLADSGDRGLLQGWALLHNDTDEDWSKVKVELVNGQPDSFLFPLAAPRYARRPLAEPEEQLATVPQLLDTTVDQIWGDNLEAGTLGHGSGVGTGQGFGSGHGRLGAGHTTRAPKVRMGFAPVSSDSLRIGNLASIAPAEGVEAGALFSYTLAQPLDLRAHGSALVPFLASQVLTRRITWFSTPDEPGRSALRFVNATRQTLPAGPIAIYEHGGFAGEAGLDRLKPTERTFLQFGADLDVELKQKDGDSREEPQLLTFKDRALIEHFFRHHRQQYETVNRSRSMRTLYLVIDIVDNSKIEGADDLDYDKASAKPLVIFKSDPGKKQPRNLKIQEGLQRSTHIDSLTAQRLEELAGDKLPPADRAILKEAAARLHEAETKTLDREDTQASLDELNKDLERLREHLSALGDKSGQGANANPIVKRILDAEDKLAVLRQKLKTLEAAVKDRRKAAETALEKLKKD
jgi:hypothetical protein